MERQARSFAPRARSALRALEELASALRAAEADSAATIAALPDEEARASARNLVHYVALRRVDLRTLQGELTRLGLSSLGRAESDVLGAIDAVCEVLQRALGIPVSHVAPRPRPPLGTFLRQRASALFGDAPAPCVMVTMPSEAATNPDFVREVVESGMHVMRINAAHDGESQARAMVAHLRRAERATGRRCKVLIDLPGPKLRTLPLNAGARVLKLKPTKDDRGRVTCGASVLLRPPPTDAGDLDPSEGELWLPESFLAEIPVGAELRLLDARKRRRTLHVAERVEASLRCTAERTTYIDADSVLRFDRHEGHLEARPLRVRAIRSGIRLTAGDTLELHGASSRGHEAQFSSSGEKLAPARVTCGLPELIAALVPGHRVLFDDGKIAAVVESVKELSATLRIVHTSGESAVLRAEKGINIPDSELALPALSPQDLKILATASEVADMVGLSFVRSAGDVRILHGELDRLGSKLSVVVKIETRSGFEELPNILLEALQRPGVGVMIARGDLAVECGFERLAELQEEMLWLCEAAHVPAIWATQVLESLAKQGQATRAEVTDAAMAERAECVMLNKGPYIIDAVRTLNDIFERMRGHQSKKRSMLRPLLSPRLVSAP